MCLIVHKPKGVIFHETWLRDFYKRNDDGFGILHAEDDQLHIHKSLGNADRFVAAFAARKDKECLIHLRMRTHGKVDLENCHPYEVLTPEQGGVLGAVWMMHNGVLGYGNDADRDKSDTWHYIKTFLRPILVKCPLLLLDDSFQKLVGREIGYNNKFAFMSGSGDVVIINQSSGVMWNEAWLSNTYAWSASDARIPGVSNYSYSGGNSSTNNATSYGYGYEAGEYHRVTHGDSTYRRGAIWRDGHWVENEETPTSKVPTQSSWPWDTHSKSTTLSPGEFFQILNAHKFTEAYAALSAVEVLAAIRADEPGLIEMIGEIEKGGFKPKIDDEFIISWVRRVGTKPPTQAAAEAVANAITHVADAVTGVIKDRDPRHVAGDGVIEDAAAIDAALDADMLADCAASEIAAAAIAAAQQGGES